MNYKKYLIDQGFMYSEVKGVWLKGKGFGSYVSVCMIVKGLFEITKNGEVLFSDFVDSFEDFKNKVNETL